MSPWAKIPKAPYYLEVWKGKRKTSYRVFYRAHGLDLRDKLAPPKKPGEDRAPDEFKTWKDALEEADRVINLARFGKKPEKDEVTKRVEADERELVRCEDVIAQLLKESETNDRAKTQEEKKLTFRHLTEWLNENCPHVSGLSVATWPAYKAYLRKRDKTVALENHAKRFRMFEIRCHDLGLTPKRIKIKFDVEKEDFREEGMLIPDEDFLKMLAAATPKHFGKIPRIQPKWRDRMILQRRTGLRPGEARNLEKARVKVFFSPEGVEIASIHIPPGGSKNATDRTFLVQDPAVLELLKRRARHVEGPYFFPSETDPKRPMDKHLTGWKGILRRAGVNPAYTPHDLRHTYATEMFQRTKNYAALCYQLDMSIETAQKVYLHLDAKDTAELAALAADSEGEGQK